MASVNKVILVGNLGKDPEGLIDGLPENLLALSPCVYFDNGVH